MKTLLALVLAFSCVDAARADAILMQDGRRLSGTGLPHALPAAPFEPFNASIASTAGLSSQTSSVTATAFSGTLKAAVDGMHTTVYDSIFGVSFVLQEACAYALHAAITSHSMLSDTFYSFSLNDGVLSLGGFNPGVLTVDRSGVLSPGQYSLSLFTEALHPEHQQRSISDIATNFSFTLTPVATPEPASLLILAIGMLPLVVLRHRYRARANVRQISRFIARNNAECVRARR